MAKKYADKNILSPMNAIWCDAVINKYNETAQEIWSKYIQNKATVEFRPIIDKAIKDNDDAMLCELIEYLQTANVSKPTLDGLNAGLLSIYLNNERFDGALEIAKILKSNQRSMRPNDLRRLKAGLEKDGKEFPFESDLGNEFDSAKRRVE